MTFGAPSALTRFIGRDEEIATVQRLVRSHRLVTLVGMGGIGKTRLAGEVAQGFEPADYGDVTLVSLTSVPSTCSRDELYAHLARSLHIAHTQPSLRVLLTHLADRPALIVLDNCEHVLAPVHAVLVALLQLLPRLRVLATSRSKLGIDGERVVKVTSLSLPDQPTRPALAKSEAAQMLTAQVEAVMGRDLIGRTDPAVVFELCQRLGGRPLWIRLAAARLSVLTIDELLQRLRDSLDVLADGRAAQRRSPEQARHASAYAVINDSYQLCSDDEQLLWTRLSVFTGTFDLHDAESVFASTGGGRAEVLDLISGLVDQSILEQVAGAATKRTRFEMLFEMRAFGRRKLEELGQQASAHGAYQRYHQHLLEQAATTWFGPNEVEVLTRVHERLPDITACIRDAIRNGDTAAARRMGTAWVSTNAPFFGGHSGTAAQLLDEVLAAGSPAKPQAPEQTLDHVAVLACAVWVALNQGHQDKATTLLRECQQRADRLRDSVPDGPTARWLAGTVGFARGSHTLLVEGDRAAVGQLAQAREALRAAGPDAAGAAAMATLLWAMAWGLVGDDPEQALRAAAQCRREAERAGAPWMTAWALWAEGLAHLMAGDLPAAARRVRRSLRDHREWADLWGRVWGIELYAWILAASDASGRRRLWDVRGAAWLLAACETVQRRIGVRLDGLKPFALQHTAARERVRAILSSSVLDEALTAGSVATIDDTMVFVLNDDVVEPRAMGLTLREAHVARLVHSGLTSKEIAAQLSIRPRSVDQILYNAMRKLGVHSRHDIPL